MSWSMSFFAVKDRSIADILQTIGQASVTGAIISGQEALALDLPDGHELALAEIQGWCVVSEPLGVIADSEGDWGDLLPSFSHGTIALDFYLFGGTGTCTLRLCENGEERRFVFHETGEIREERGAPLPEEATIPMPAWGYDEDWVFAVFEHVTGLTRDTILSAHFTLASALTLSPS